MRTQLCKTLGYCATFMLGVVATTTALAVDGVWTNTVGGSWTNTANWATGVVPGGVGSAITFTNSTADSTVTLDGARTIGSLQVGLGNKKWYFQPGTGGTLTLDTGTAQQPAIVTTNGGNRTIIYAPVAGTNGFRLSGTDKSRLELIATNTYSGVTRVESAYLHVRTGAALGNSPRVELVPSSAYSTVMFVADGATLTNTILFRAGMVSTAGRAQLQTESVAGSTNPTIRLNGDIIVSGNSSSVNQIINDQYADLIINGAVTNDGSAGVVLTLTGDKGRIIVNGRVNLTGALGKNGLCTNMINVSGNVYGGDFVLYSGNLIMGVTNAFCPSYGINLTQYGTNATLNLNGYDQTVKGLANGMFCHRITSATNATLTLDSNGSSYNYTLGGTIDGALSLVKRGVGTQQFGASNTNVMTGGTFVYGGTLQMNGTSRANVTVDGGTFNGSGWLTCPLGATSDKLTLLSGSLNVSNLNIRLTGTPALKTYTVVDYSAGGTFTTSGTTNIFASVAGMPSGYKWLNDAGAKKVYLLTPVRGTVLAVH